MGIRRKSSGHPAVREGLAESNVSADDQIALMSVDCIGGDRRADKRYDFQMDVRFEYSEQGVTYFGAGVTIDLSGGGVRFRADTPPPPAGIEAELKINWPFLLQRSCALELVVWGSILGTRGGATVLRMRRYEFRTRGERSFTETQDGPAIRSIVA